MDGHQVDGVDGVDDGVRLVAAGDQLREVVRRAAPAWRSRDSGCGGSSRGSSSGSRAPARSPAPPISTRIGGLGEHAIDELGRRQPIDQRRSTPARLRRAPAAAARDRRLEQRRAAPAASPVSAPARPGASSFSASSDSRTMRERRNAAARRFDPGSARYASEREHVLDFVGVEEAQALVDVVRHAAPRQRRLEQAVALARAEQHGDVAGADRPPHAGVAIADGRAVDQQPRDLVGHGLGLRGIRVGATTTPSAHRRAVAARPSTSGKRIVFASSGTRRRGPAPCRSPSNTSLTNVSSSRHRSEAARDRGARRRVRAAARRCTAPPRRAPPLRRRGSRRSTACDRRR